MKCLFLLIYLMMIQINGSLSAAALPAPMDEEQLLSHSNFVGEILVLGVTRVADDDKSYSNYTVASYNAWLKVDKVLKGNLKPSDTILACWHELPKLGYVGGWYISFQPGELAKVYMVWDEDNKCYKATSWTAKQLIDSNNNVLETRMLDEVKFVELKKS